MFNNPGQTRLLLTFVIISVEVHAPSPSIVSCITVPEQMVQKPPYDKVILVPLNTPVCVPLAYEWRCITKDLDDCTIDSSWFHLSIRESVRHIGMLGQQVPSIGANCIVSDVCFCLCSVSTWSIRPTLLWCTLMERYSLSWSRFPGVKPSASISLVFVALGYTNCAIVAKVHCLVMPTEVQEANIKKSDFLEGFAEYRQQEGRQRASVCPRHKEIVDLFVGQVEESKILTALAWFMAQISTGMQWCSNHATICFYHIPWTRILGLDRSCRKMSGFRLRIRCRVSERLSIPLPISAADIFNLDADLEFRNIVQTFQWMMHCRRTDLPLPSSG